ncbi:hypothetical protein SAMN04487785_10914 [Dyella jiangningensis]|nr:hypothetical protein BDW41_10813 [Dyella sp. AtDHG13]SDK59950.1 hypothetical protein SAMN04487785_10914 [Dyella jiangningensis]
MQTTTPNRTAVIGLCTMCIGVLLLKYSATAGKLAMGLGILAMVSTGSVQGFSKLMAAARCDLFELRHAFLARKRLWLRRARHVTKPSAAASLGWQLSVLLFTLVMFVGGAFEVSIAGLSIATETVSRIALTVALFDLCIMGLRVMRWPWGRSAGKWLKAAVAAILAGIALSMARQIVAGLTGEDPSKFPATVALLAGLCVPLAWATIATVVAAVTILPAMVLSFRRMTRDETPPMEHSYFLARGAAIIRPILLCLALLQIGFFATPPDLNKHPLLRYASVVLLVHMDFWDQTVCGTPNVLAARITDDRYLKVNPNEQVPTLHVATCLNKDAQPAGSKASTAVL